MLKQVQRPRRALVTAGMIYANGPMHIGHLAGAQLPADIYSRWLGLLIGRENVLFVNGTDDHGSASEVAALKEGVPIRAYIDRTHEEQRRTLLRYSIAQNRVNDRTLPFCCQPDSLIDCCMSWGAEKEKLVDPEPQ